MKSFVLLNTSIILSLYLITQIKSDDTATRMSCPGELNLINQYSCAADLNLAPPSQCRAVNTECFNGECVPEGKDKDSYCPYAFACPLSENVRCPDNTCVQSKDDCHEYEECPSFSPIRCFTGDCRKTLEDCPSPIHCPSHFNYLCNDGSCKLLTEGCKTATKGTQCKDGKTRCPDGTCADSKFLCPTIMSCPDGYEKCWNGNCVKHGECKDVGMGESTICNAEGDLLCQFDFSCVKDIKNCATGILCPVNKPVRCWDNSCRDSIQNCPAFQKCPSGLTECPDGSCGLGSCGTHITCSDDAPFRCFDNTCRRNPEDCPEQPSCSSETPILCWDGRCLAERGECLAPTACESLYPVKCPNGLCSKSQSSCKEEIECPSEFVRCSDGTCRKKLAYCPEEQCPVNLPFKCKNGLCVSDEKYCDHDNGCPYNLPVKCENEDGLCFPAGKKCSKESKCPSGKKVCPDGSCLSKNVVCPSVNGCPSDTPFRCADGSCINPKKMSCSIPKCDPSIPVKCFDGTCVKTISYCPTERKTAASGFVLCANGQEANSYDECKPLTICEEGQTRCDDGTCRNKKEECPLAKTCPNNQIRCDNGSCSESKDKCPKENGCPESSPFKCEKTGFCVDNNATCATVESELTESSGCPKETPYKCTGSGMCVKTKDDCFTDYGCGKGLFMCDNGECKVDKDDCDPMKDICEGEYTVYCGYPYKQPCAKSIDQCLNYMGCPLNAPNRCSDGSCRRFPAQRFSGDKDGCEVSVSCPSYKPFLCADGSCMEKESFCKSFSACPKDKPYLCFDKSCVASKDQCSIKCPAKNPLLCDNGKCVTSIFDCSYESCPYWMPIHCVNGDCTTKPSECTKLYIDPDSFIKKDYVLCTKDEVLCYDGSCRKNQEECPLYPGCGSSDLPYKCLDGGCAKSKEECTNENDPEKFTCEEGKTLCIDGLCREKCENINYYGCPNEAPLLCPSGRCVTELQECVGESGCDSTDYPFRCIDGTCVSSIAECKTAFREYGTTNITLSVYPQMEVNAELIIGKDNALIGSIKIPSDSITYKADSSKVKKGAETQIYLKSVPRSQLHDTWIYYNRTRVDDLKSVYPYADEGNNYTLTYEYAVLSPAVELKLKDPATTIISGRLMFTLLYDFPFRHENLKRNKTVYTDEEETTQQKRYSTLPLDYLKDACLAKLDEKKRLWNCTGFNIHVEDLNNLQLTGELNEEGIYAVVLSTRINTHPLYIEPNWLLAHLKEVTIAFLVLLFLIGFGFYIFIRIYRYRVKYKGTKEIYKGFELELSDLQDKSVTGRQGQTYGDVKEGIIYTDNIAFKSQIDSDARKKNTQLEKLFDAFTKRLRLLERNNALLKSQYESMKTEYNRLTEYKKNYENDHAPGNLEVKVSVGAEIRPSGGASIGAINDPGDD